MSGGAIGPRVATTLGYGLRFLHSTGQLHKGGPNSGVFLQITCDDAEDVPIPGQKFGFSILKRTFGKGRPPLSLGKVAIVPCSALQSLI